VSQWLTLLFNYKFDFTHLYFYRNVESCRNTTMRHIHDFVVWAELVHVYVLSVRYFEDRGIVPFSHLVVRMNAKQKVPYKRNTSNCQITLKNCNNTSSFPEWIWNNRLDINIYFLIMTIQTQLTVPFKYFGQIFLGIVTVVSCLDRKAINSLQLFL